MKALEKLDDDKLKDLVGSGDADSESELKLYTALQTKGDVVYIPAGFAIIEQVVSGPLIYGSRKLVLFKSDVMAESYATVMGCMRRDGKETAKWAACHQAMRETDEVDEDRE